MQKSEAIEKIIADANYRNLCNRIDRNGDLYQNFILWLLEMPDKKLLDLYAQPGFKYYMVRVITQTKGIQAKDNAWNKKHQFCLHMESIMVHHEYREPFDHDTIDKIEKELDNLPVCVSGFSYEKELLKLFVECGSISEVSRQTGISYKSIRTAVNATKQHIKNKIQNTSNHSA